MQAAPASAPDWPAPFPVRDGGDAPAWALLDDPSEWGAFGRLMGADEGDRWESHLAVEGMHCAACAFTLEAALAGLPGMQQIEVNAASQRIRLVWSAALVSPSAWFRAAAAAGYRLVPASDIAARARRADQSRQALWRWLVAGFCMMQVMMYAAPAYFAEPGDITPDMVQLLRWASWVLTLPVMLFSCGPFFAGAWRDLRERRIGMDTPVAIGMAIAFVVSSAATFDPKGLLGHEVYFDSLTMFVFFLLTGRWLEARLRDRTAGALDALMNRLPDSIARRDAEGRFTRIAVRRLAIGDVVRVLPGEAFPADGTVLAGDTTTDEALLTGESRPVPCAAGAPVFAGSLNLSAPVEVRIDALGDATRFGQIARLMESAALSKPRIAQQADRIAKPFLLLVLAAAALAAVYWWPQGHGHALMVAAAVLIVTCPCALSLATPAAMLASAGALARRGIMVGNLQALEALAAIDTVVFDKTGTLTRDVPRLLRVYSRSGIRPGDAVERAAALARGSLHPVARSLAQAWDAKHRVPPPWTVSQTTEHSGQGIEGTMLRDGSDYAVPLRVRLGAAAFCGVRPMATDSMQVHLCDEAGWMASFLFAEDLRADACETVAALRADGVTVRVLSGDRSRSAVRVAEAAGIAGAQGDCSPEDKLDAVQRMQEGGQRVAMVGDGVNDGPVLAQADVSFAFGQSAALARSRADFVVLGDALSTIPQSIRQAKRTLRVVRQSLAWAAAYNAACVPLALVGWLPAWLAGLGMAASSVVVVLNAARLSRSTETPA